MWDYMVEEISERGPREIELKLREFGSEGWELVNVWSVPGDTHINKGEPRTYFLFKQPKSV
ncbi:MAG: hypothetical protein WA192_12655 [Candidatus Acidiferrales bacterium]